MRNFEKNKSYQKHEYLYKLLQGYNTQHYLLIMIENWNERLDNGNQNYPLITNLYRVFDFVNHDLLIKKLDAYGFDNQASGFVFSYLSDRKQK